MEPFTTIPFTYWTKLRLFCQQTSRLAVVVLSLMIFATSTASAQQPTIYDPDSEELNELKRRFVELVEYSDTVHAQDLRGDVEAVWADIETGDLVIIGDPLVGITYTERGFANRGLDAPAATELEWKPAIKVGPWFARALATRAESGNRDDLQYLIPLTFCFARHVRHVAKPENQDSIAADRYAFESVSLAAKAASEMALLIYGTPDAIPQFREPWHVDATVLTSVERDIANPIWRSWVHTRFPPVFNQTTQVGRRIAKVLNNYALWERQSITSDELAEVLVESANASFPEIERRARYIREREEGYEIQEYILYTDLFLLEVTYSRIAGTLRSDPERPLGEAYEAVLPATDAALARLLEENGEILQQIRTRIEQRLGINGSSPK